MCLEIESATAMDAEKSQQKLFFKCALPHCRGLRFNLTHKFPRNLKRSKYWLEAFNNPVLDATPHLRLLHQCVCSRHFRIADYIHPESRKLNLNAVPSLNLKTLDELDKCRHGPTNKVVEYSRDRLPETENSNELQGNNSNEENNAPNDSNISLVSKVLISQDVHLLNDNIVASNGEVGDTTLAATFLEDNSNGFELVANEGFIQIKDAQVQSLVKADILWLRHLCRCGQCFDNKENRHLINFFELDNDLQPVMATVVEETRRLDIIWSDGHTSTYDLNQLYENLQQKQQPIHSPTQLLWNFQHTQYRNHLEPINWYDLMQSNNTATCKALERLQKFGVLTIKQVPKQDKDSLFKKAILTKLFNHSWNNFITETRKKFQNHHYTTPFSNCTFESMDKGLQILTVPYNKEHLKLQLNLIDGFEAIEQLPKTSQDFLTQFQLDYSFSDDKDFKYKTKKSVILKDCNVERIWFAPFHLDDIKSQEFRLVSKHFKILNDIINMQQNQWQMELNTETIIILDNYRICWCFKEAVKDCELECIYMERKHYLSSLNVLKNINEL